MDSRSGDLHSNASLTRSQVRLSTKLLEHHAGHNEEILAIVAHELGHWYKDHLKKSVLVNVVYMTIFGAIMVPFVDNKEFLFAFSIGMESYYMQLVLYILLY